jgi:cell shape-determining protein MreC
MSGNNFFSIENINSIIENDDLTFDELRDHFVKSFDEHNHQIMMLTNEMKLLQLKLEENQIDKDQNQNLSKEIDELKKKISKSKYIIIEISTGN